MRRQRSNPLIALAVIGLMMITAVGPIAAQGNSNPSVDAGDIVSGIARSFGSMFSGLLTDYDPAATLTGAYAGIPMSRTDDGAFLLGDPNAPITVIEFADFACTHCIAYKPVMDRFIDTYVRTGKAAFEFRFLPTAGGQLTVIAAAYAECTDVLRPGTFWSSYELLYNLAETGSYNARVGQTLARQLHLNQTDLDNCAQTADQVFVDSRLAQTLSVGGTPAVLIRHGDEQPDFIRQDGQTFNQGGVPFDILRRAVLGNVQSL